VLKKLRMDKAACIMVKSEPSLEAKLNNTLYKKNADERRRA